MRSRSVTVLAVLSAALVSGGWLMHRGFDSPRESVDGARLFDDVKRHVEQYYVDSVSQSDVYRKAIDGMLYELHDPHTVFLSPDRLRRLTESTTGTYAGLGIQIDVRNGWITIIAPLPGTPAERAGLESGDRIVEINGKTTHGLTPDEATKALRGTPGTKVDIAVERPGVEGKMPFRVERQNIHTRAVTRATMLRPDVGYVDVNVFGDSTASELAAAIDSLSHAGMKSLVLDLRNNPGGLLDQGVGVSELFLDPGKEIVSMRGRTPDTRRAFTDRMAQRWPSLPIVLLVNEGSASASEIVAGALQDHDRAAIVGRTSYGKGSAQSLFEMANGGALKVTTALWYTPSGRSINKKQVGADDSDDDGAEPDSALSKVRETFRTDAKRVVYGGGGITPDVVVGDSEAAPAEQALQRALGNKVPQFRDALTEYALSLKGSHGVSSADFAVTPAMRDELYRRVTARGAAVPRTTWDSAGAVVDRLLSYEIARYVFGPGAEFLRVARNDDVIATALDLLAGAPSQADLLRRAASRQAERTAERERAASSAR